MPPTPERVATPLRVAGSCACAAATACAVSGDNFTERLPRNASREVGEPSTRAFRPPLPPAESAGSSVQANTANSPQRSSNFFIDRQTFRFSKDMIFPPKCMTREVKSPRSSEKGDFFTIFATEYHYDYEFQENIAAHRAAAHRRPGAQNLDQDPYAPRRVDRRLPRLVPAAVHREQRRGLRHAHRLARRLRLGQAAAGRLPDRHGRIHRLADAPPLHQTPRHAQGSDRRPRADLRRRHGQHPRQRILRIDLLRIDALHGGSIRGALRRVYDGQSGRHVLFPAVPMEQRTPPAAVSGRQQQLFLRRDLQSGRCLHLGGSRLSASVSAQVLQQVDFF